MGGGSHPDPVAPTSATEDRNEVGDASQAQADRAEAPAIALSKEVAPAQSITPKTTPAYAHVASDSRAGKIGQTQEPEMSKALEGTGPSEAQSASKPMSSAASPALATSSQTPTQANVPLFASRGDFYFMGAMLIAMTLLVFSALADQRRELNEFATTLLQLQRGVGSLSAEVWAPKTYTTTVTAFASAKATSGDSSAAGYFPSGPKTSEGEPEPNDRHIARSKEPKASLSEIITAFKRQHWYVSIGARIFFFVQQAMSWDDARKFALANHGSLAAVSDSATRQELHQLVVHHNVDFWVGGRRVGEHFRWEGGISESRSMSYENWATGEPNNGGKYGFFGPENCVALRPDSLWNDEHCNRLLPFILEIRTS